MADTTYGYTPGSGGNAAVDRISTTDYPYYKIKWGAPGTVNDATAANPFPVTAVGSVAVSTVGGQTPAYGSGVTGATVQRVTIASDQLSPLVNGGVPTVPAGREVATVAPGATTLLGATGAVGDYIEGILCVVTTPATSQVSITDGNGTAKVVFPANPGAGIGTYPVPLGWSALIATTPGFRITAGAGVTVHATGDFT
jgi:hypothetical protein